MVTLCRYLILNTTAAFLAQMDVKNVQIVLIASRVKSVIGEQTAVIVVIQTAGMDHVQIMVSVIEGVKMVTMVLPVQKSVQKCVIHV